MTVRSARTGEPMHDCPGPRCTRRVPDRLLMCGPHWRLVPADLQRAVYAAYNHGRGVGSMELLTAQTAAIAAVNRSESPRGES
jgi:hypothetical protein